MLRIIQLLLLAFVVFVVATVVAFALLPWWKALIVVIGMMVVIGGTVAYLVGRVATMFGGAVTKALEIHALVLRGAETEVHEVLPVERPAESPSTSVQSEPISGPRAYYQIDVTVRPANPDVNPERLWEPADLRLVPADATVEPLKASDVLQKKVLEKGFRALNIQIENNGGYEPADAGDKLDGPRRLRILVVLPASLRQVKFRYLTELFGHIDLPTHTSPSTPQLPSVGEATA